MSENLPPATCDINLLRRTLTQRNQAIACAVLSITLSLALIMNTFLGHRKELVAANQQILVLQQELTNAQNALRANEQALLQTQEALKTALAAKGH